MITMTPSRATIEDFASYCGFQEGSETLPGFELWNLTRDIPGHPVGSTVARSTIERHLARQSVCNFLPGANPDEPGQR